jgi:1-deoxy-D-xylulose-5-phosphate synthase
MPFDIDTGKPIYSFEGEDYGSLTCDFLLKKMKEDSKVVAVVAGVPTNIGFTDEKRKEAGKQFIDVGIAEEHAIAMISGIAKNGGKPIFATHSSFMQRTYDQLSQDLCVNNNPATILVNTASVYGMNDVTHLGIFDIPLISNIPNMVYLAPTSKEEYFAMLDWSLEQQAHPVAIRIPCNGVISDNRQVDTDYSNINKYKVEQKGSNVAIIALGDFYQLGEEVSKEVQEKINIVPTVINPRYITGLDKGLLEELKDNHELVITLEDGILDGGFGEKIASYYGINNMKVKNYGLKKDFPDRYVADEFLRENGISVEQITEDIIGILHK